MSEINNLSAGENNSNDVLEIHNKIMQDQINNVESMLDEIKHADEEELNKMPSWVNDASSTEVYLYFMQIIKENHKHGLDSNKLNVSLLENMLELSKLVLSCMTVNNHSLIIKIIKQINDIISRIMVKHYTTNSNIVKEIDKIISNRPSAKLVKVMLDESPIIDNSYYSADDISKNPYYK